MSQENILSDRKAILVATELAKDDVHEVSPRWKLDVPGLSLNGVDLADTLSGLQASLDLINSKLDVIGDMSIDKNSLSSVSSVVASIVNILKRPDNTQTA